LLKPRQICGYFMDSISQDSESDTLAAEHKGVKKLGRVFVIIGVCTLAEWLHKLGFTL